MAVVLHDDAGRILLHRRRVGGGWAPPSGAVEPGEDIEQAAHREIAEETTLQASLDRLVAVYSDPTFQIVAYPDGRRIHFITTLFEAHVTAGNLDGSDEGDAWAWFHPDELPGNLLPYAQVWLRDAAPG